MFRTVEFPLQWTQTLPLLEPTLTIHSVWAIGSLTKKYTQPRSVNCGLWCCWSLSPLRYDNESNEVSRWHPPVPNDNFKEHYVLAPDLTSMQDATENFRYTERVQEALRLEINFIIPLEHVTEHLSCESECLRLQLVGLLFLEKI